MIARIEAAEALEERLSLLFVILDQKNIPREKQNGITHQLGRNKPSMARGTCNENAYFCRLDRVIRCHGMQEIPGVSS